MVYLLTILICSIIIYIPNAIVNPAGIDNPWVYYLLAVIIYIAASVVVDGIVAFVIRRFPKKWRSEERCLYRIYGSGQRVRDGNGEQAAGKPQRHR